MKNIDQSIRKVRAILRMTKAEFYVINIRECEIVLQGEYSPKLAQIFRHWKHRIVFGGFIEFRKSNVKIILT